MSEMLEKEFLRREIYAVPHGGLTVAYAPLTRSFAVHEGHLGIDDLDPEWLDDASDPDNVPDFVLEKGFAEEKKRMKIRMNVTSKCNLSCSYCSVSANMAGGAHMPRELALAAVDRLFARAKEQGMTSVELVFSGGEPTLLPDLLEEAVRFADARAACEKLTLVTKLLTNGVLSPAAARRLAPLFNGVQVSWDGNFPDHPRYGKESAAVAKKTWEAIRAFVDAGSTMNVAVVVSGANAGRVAEAVDGVHYEFGIENFTLGLKDPLGRGDGATGIDYGRLREDYLGLWTKYRRMGVDLPLTGTDIHSLSRHPCGLSAPNYSVAPDGGLSACTVAFGDRSALSDSFSIGAVADGALRIDEVKIADLAKVDVTSLKACAGCHAKWHCRGGCAYANKNLPLPEVEPERCEFTKKVVADKVLWFARRQEGVPGA